MQVGEPGGDGRRFLDEPVELARVVTVAGARDEVEGASCSGARERERSNAHQNRKAAHARQPAGAPGVKLTWGGSRCASSSTSKNSRLLKPNGPAKKTPGTV